MCHKPHFDFDPKVTLICPSRSVFGRIIELILDKYISKLRYIIKLNHWFSSTEVFNWFTHKQNKDQTKFIQIDISNYFDKFNTT